MKKLISKIPGIKTTRSSFKKCLFILLYFMITSICIYSFNSYHSNTNQKDEVNYLQNTDSTLNNNSNNIQSNENLKLHFIDVGQADSILVQQGTSAMLIDAGNNDDADVITEYIKKQGITKLDYVIGTHAHEDHIGSLDDVINTYDVSKVFFPKQTSTTKTFENYVLSVKNKGMKIYSPNVGEVFELGTATFEIMGPNSSSYEDSNNYSIVIKLKFGNNSFLLTGDAESISEKEMLTKGLDLSADVLKVGHHGSGSSTTKEFLDKVKPKYAVISVGKDNTYGHPNKLSMNRLKNASIPVYRTDEQGTIIATSDGKNITFNCKPGTYNFASSKTN